MKKVGIAIDDWKLTIFRTHLTAGGFTFQVLPGVTPDFRLITVHTVDVDRLTTVVREANNACRRAHRETKN